VHIGHDFDAHQFDAKVERGVTSREAVRSWLGAPATNGVAVGAYGERLEEWTYITVTTRSPACRTPG